MLDNPNYKLICRNIKALRRRHHLTQRQMAEIMGVGLHSVRLLERDILPPRMPAEALVRLCRRFGCSAQSLLNPME